MARIRIELLQKRFEMLCRDLDWQQTDYSKGTFKDWEGTYTIQQPWHIVQYANASGAEKRITDPMTRAEMLAWIEGAEAAVKALSAKRN